MWFTTSSGKIELNITKSQASIGFHSGPCDEDIKHLLTVPSIRRQLVKLSPELVRSELSEWGPWDNEELQNHEANLVRLLWLACADIVEYCRNLQNL